MAAPGCKISIISQISVISILLLYVDIVLSINSVKSCHYQTTTYP